MSESIEERTIRFEGFRALPYKDSLGFWTIGIGEKITEDQAQELAHGVSYEWAYERMENKIQGFRNEILSLLPWVRLLSSIRQDVLVEMAYQLGIHGLMGFHSMLNCVKNGDFEGAAHDMLESLWHQQTPSRCEELADLILNGDSAA